MVNALRKFYKTKNLAEYGRFIAVSLPVLLMLGLLIPNQQPTDNTQEQIYSMEGIPLKNNDQEIVTTFTNSIKNKNGYLCLGTSESVPRDDGNYYAYLNNNNEVPDKFSVLAGAGRTCGIHIPWLIQNREQVKSLRIIYLINPVYWRSDLSQVSLEYWNRYNEYKMVANTPIHTAEEESFFLPVQAYINRLNIFEKTTFSINYWMRSLRKNFFQNLRSHFYPNEFAENFKPFKTNLKIIAFKDTLGPDLSIYDTAWNINKSFTRKDWHRPIDTNNNYRYQELIAFIELCQYLNIEATYIVEPVNKKFIIQKAPKDLVGYEQTTDSIIHILNEHNSDFIDASDLSMINGVFIDHQHHSNYGAYLLSEKVKKHFYEKSDF